MASTAKKRKISRINGKKESKIFETTKGDLIRAVRMINSKNDKLCPMDVVFNQKRKAKVLSLCSHDSSIPNQRRQNLETLPTNTQLLLSQLRKCISEHNWAAAARCVYYLLDMNGKLLPIIWKTIIVILLNDPSVNAQRIHEFLQMCLGLRTRPEKLRFLQNLLTLPEDLNIFSKKNSTKVEMTTDDDDEDRPDN